MAFVVEDGSGLADANSYASFADWVDHWTERGELPSALQADVQKALVRGADYLGIRYCWRGHKRTAEQSLDWPRTCVYEQENPYVWNEVTGVPPEVKRANIELALRALAGELAPDPTLDASGQTVVSSRDKVGPLETELTFTGGAPSTFVKRFPAVDRLLRCLVVSEGGRVYRA